MIVYVLVYIYTYIYIYYNYTWLYINIYMYQWVTALKEPHLQSINPYKFRSLNFRLRDFRRWNHFDLAEQETSFQWTTGNGLSQYMSPEIWVEQLAGQIANSKPADTVNMTLSRIRWSRLIPFQCWWLLYIFITILQLVNTCNWCCNCPEEALDFLVFHCRWLWWSSEPPFSAITWAVGSVGSGSGELGVFLSSFVAFLNYTP